MICRGIQTMLQTNYVCTKNCTFMGNICMSCSIILSRNPPNNSLFTDTGQGCIEGITAKNSYQNRPNILNKFWPPFLILVSCTGKHNWHRVGKVIYTLYIVIKKLVNFIFEKRFFCMQKWSRLSEVSLYRRKCQIQFVIQKNKSLISEIHSAVISDIDTELDRY